MPASESKPPVTLVDRFVVWTKSNRVTAVGIILAMIVAGVATFADSVRKLVNAVIDLGGKTTTLQTKDPRRTEQLERATALVLGAYSRALAQPVLDYRPPTRDEYAAAESELRTLLLLYQSRGSADQERAVETGLEMWKEMRNSNNISAWQLDRLMQRRAEWVVLFGSLGYEVPRDNSAPSLPAPKK